MGGFSFANLQGGMFDPRNVDPTPSFVVPPLDNYKVVATSSEPKETNDKTGGYLQFNLQIIEGQYSGVVVPYRLNIFNQDTRTVEIAYKQLSALGHVTGQLWPLQNSAQMHNIPFIARIGPQKNNEQYSNVYAVMDLQGNIPGKKAGNAVAATPVAQPPAPLGTPGPWGPTAAPIASFPAQPAATPWATNPPAPSGPWGPPAPNYAPQPPAQQPAQQATPWSQPQQPQAPVAAPAGNQPPWMAQPPNPAPGPTAPAWPPR